MDLHDFQQDFILTPAESDRGVKFSLFVASGLLQKLLGTSGEETVSIPSLKSLFQMKALVTASRSATRDWLDLYLLMTKHGFSMEDYANAFLSIGAKLELDTGLTRISSGKASPVDTGYEAIGRDLPSVEVVTSYFRLEVDRWKKACAEKQLGKKLEEGS